MLNNVLLICKLVLGRVGWASPRPGWVGRAWARNVGPLRGRGKRGVGVATNVGPLRGRGWGVISGLGFWHMMLSLPSRQTGIPEKSFCISNRHHPPRPTPPYSAYSAGATPYSAHSAGAPPHVLRIPREPPYSAHSAGAPPHVLRIPREPHPTENIICKN